MRWEFLSQGNGTVSVFLMGIFFSHADLFGHPMSIGYQTASCAAISTAVQRRESVAQDDLAFVVCQTTEQQYRFNGPCPSRVRRYEVG